MNEGYPRRPEERATVWQIAIVACFFAMPCIIACGYSLKASRLQAENAALRARNTQLKQLKNPPLSQEQKAAEAVAKEIAWQSWHMPAEIQSELIDQPTLAYGIVGANQKQFADPHDDPEWHHTRREFANEHCCCMVRGCIDDPKGDAIHHGIAANACVKAGYYDLAVKPGPGQKFYRLCEKHHAAIGHGIGHGGSWAKFNLDIDADVKAGKWNSRGKSEWRLKTDHELIAWVKEKVEPAPVPEQVGGNRDANERCD